MGIFDGITAQQPGGQPVAAGTLASARAQYISAVRDEVLRMNGDDSIDLDAANARFSGIAPLDEIERMSVAIVGVGGLGNWQWQVVMAMGFKTIAIFDDDTVDIENVGSQRHNLADLGRPKVEAARDAGIVYRGVSMTAINRRVGTMQDINEALGYVPDILITCTDSTTFRNNLIDTLIGERDISMLPKFFLDYRMTLGKWVCFATPVRLLRDLFGSASYRDMMRSYAADAVFPESEAIQEPCTARGIAFTGANCASFTGAILLWYVREMANIDLSDAAPGRFAMMNSFMQSDGNTAFSHKTSMDALEWQPLTITMDERHMQREYDELTGIYRETEDTLRALAKAMLPEGTDSRFEVSLYPSLEGIEAGDYVLVRDHNAVYSGVVYTRPWDTYHSAVICRFDGVKSAPWNGTVVARFSFGKNTTNADTMLARAYAEGGELSRHDVMIGSSRLNLFEDSDDRRETVSVHMAWFDGLVDVCLMNDDGERFEAHKVTEYIGTAAAEAVTTTKPVVSEDFVVKKYMDISEGDIICPHLLFDETVRMTVVNVYDILIECRNADGDYIAIDCVDAEEVMCFGTTE